MKYLGLALVTILLLSWSLIITGCQSREVEQTAIAVGTAADWSEDSFVVTVQLAQAVTQEQSSTQESPESIVLSERGQTLSESARRLNLLLPRLPLWFHASTLLLGEDLAKRGITDIVDFLYRSINIRHNTLLVMTRGATAAEVLQVQTPLEPHSAAAIRRILETQENQTGIYVPITVDEFLYRIATPGIDPVLPQVRIIIQGGQKLLKIDGMAVFRGTEWAGELNETESRGFRFLSPKQIRGGLIIIPAPGDETRFVTIELISSQAKAKPILEEGQLRMLVEIKADGNFYDQTSPLPLVNLETFNILEEMTAHQMEKEIYQAVRKAQEYKADIFGWGRLVQINDPALWSQVEKDWPEVFSQIAVDVKVDFELRRTYLTDRSFIIK
ncbi:MAG TPA: Ger(x)C family spore germination protein [Syntrophomonadaceae bacterium]|nr:Ger(x)C family spore germination protein [Syntrophomonadaceae bacterium]HOQ09933.1 Ger(x)C family spore germination protein [Syntrophomonadaceae bacterium]